MEKRNYECMMIISSKISDEKRDALITKFKTMASSKTKVDKMGLRKFSVPINYRDQGFYVLMHFEAESTIIAEMTKIMNFTDGIERFVFISKDEKMLKADAERREKRAQARTERVAKEQSEVKE